MDRDSDAKRARIGSASSSAWANTAPQQQQPYAAPPGPPGPPGPPNFHHTLPPPRPDSQPQHNHFGPPTSAFTTPIQDHRALPGSGPPHPGYPFYGASHESSVKRSPGGEPVQLNYPRPRSPGREAYTNMQQDDLRRHVLFDGGMPGPPSYPTYPPRQPPPMPHGGSFESYPQPRPLPPGPVPTQTPSAETSYREGQMMRPKRPQRSSQACDNCRTKKTKCDEAKPCTNCKKEGFQCTYKEPIAKP